MGRARSGGFIVALALAGAAPGFAVAALQKLRSPHDFVRAVAACRLPPDVLVFPVARLLPLIGLAALLLLALLISLPPLPSLPALAFFAGAAGLALCTLVRAIALLGPAPSAGQIP